MVRPACLLALCLLGGCTFRLGGGPERSEEIERLLADGDGRGSSGSSWGIRLTGTEPSPLPTAQDDAAFFRGAGTRVASESGLDGDALADAIGKGSLAGVKSVLEKGLTPGAGTPSVVEPVGKGPRDPAAAALGAAIDAWEAYKRERGIAPADLSPQKPAGANDKTGP